MQVKMTSLYLQQYSFRTEKNDHI